MQNQSSNAITFLNDKWGLIGDEPLIFENSKYIHPVHPKYVLIILYK